MMPQKGRTVKFLDPNHPMFRRAWVRCLTVLLPLGWGVVEMMTGNPRWALLFAAAGAYAFWALILQGPDRSS